MSAVGSPPTAAGIRWPRKLPEHKQPWTSLIPIVPIPTGPAGNRTGRPSAAHLFPMGASRDGGRSEKQIRRIGGRVAFAHTVQVASIRMPACCAIRFPRRPGRTTCGQQIDLATFVSKAMCGTCRSGLAAHGRIFERPWRPVSGTSKQVTAFVRADLHLSIVSFRCRKLRL